MVNNIKWGVGIIPTLRRLWQEDCRFKANLSYLEIPSQKIVLIMNILTG